MKLYNLKKGMFLLSGKTSLLESLLTGTAMVLGLVIDPFFTHFYFTLIVAVLILILVDKALSSIKFLQTVIPDWLVMCIFVFFGIVTACLHRYLLVHPIQHIKII